MSRAPAVTATIAALALINLGLATVIVSAMGQRGIAPGWLGVILIAAGAAAAVAAIFLWRGYLADLQQR